MQLMWGAPMHISRGGFRTSRCATAAPSRADRVPDATAALVHCIGADFVKLELVNLDLTAGRTVVVQTGSFGEHRFVEASVDGVDLVVVDGRWLEVVLRPESGARFRITMDRYVQSPSYETPWSRHLDWVRLSVPGRQGRPRTLR